MVYIDYISALPICSWVVVFIKALPIILPATLLVTLLVFLFWKKWRKKLFNKLTKKTSILKVIYVIVAFIIGFALIVLFSLLYSQVISTQCTAPQTGNPSNSNGLSIQNLALAFLGTMSGLAALFGVFLAILRSEENKRQNDTAEQGQITERLNKAIENLGKSDKDGDPVIEVRIGALFALERIAQDSIRDHIQIMEIFCAYIRHNSPLPNDTDETNVPNTITAIKAKRRKNKNELIDEDIQTAITIIGRRDKWSEGKKRLKKELDHKHEINLFECNLCGAKFSDANLNRAILIGSDMRRGWFDGTSLIDASLGSADLTGAWFEKAELENANFGGATTDRMWSYEGSFLNCRELTQVQLDVMYCRKDVKIPKMDGETELVCPDHWSETELSFREFQGKCAAWVWDKYKVRE